MLELLELFLMKIFWSLSTSFSNDIHKSIYLIDELIQHHLVHCNDRFYDYLGAKSTGNFALKVFKILVSIPAVTLKYQAISKTAKVLPVVTF